MCVQQLLAMTQCTIALYNGLLLNSLTYSIIKRAFVLSPQIHENIEIFLGLRMLAVLTW
jgi:hypothetical protein